VIRKEVYPFRGQEAKTSSLVHLPRAPFSKEKTGGEGGVEKGTLPAVAGKLAEKLFPRWDVPNPPRKRRRDKKSSSWEGLNGEIQITARGFVHQYRRGREEEEIHRPLLEVDAVRQKRETKALLLDGVWEFQEHGENFKPRSWKSRPGGKWSRFRTSVLSHVG